MKRAPRIAIVGTGPVARALAAAYVQGGGRVAAIVSRSARRGREAARRTGAARGSSSIEDAAGADVVVVSVPDRALPAVARALASLAKGGPRLVLHTSGALPGAVLRPSRIRAGSLHPLQSFPDVRDAALLCARVPGAHWFHEGEGAVDAAAMVRVWRGRLHRLAPGGKTLYHAGAAMLSNHTVALMDAALRAFEAAGVPRSAAAVPLASLLAGTSANVAASGVPAALTGPIARGDVATVRAHLAALAKSLPELVESYRAMARRTLVVARAKGSIPRDAARELDRVLRGR